MSRVLLVGVGPLPHRELRRLYAPGLRLEAFLGALERAGCEVLLGEIYFADIGEPFRPRSGARIREHRQLSGTREAITAQLNAWVENESPDAVVALTDVGALSVTRTEFAGPLHVDYFGHPMAERQQLAAVHGNDEALHGQWLDVLPVLLRADRFSACSNDQRLALIGELGAAGRLNAATDRYPFVEIVPPTLSFTEPLVAANRAILREKGIPDGARTILSSGGYNTWMDPETLFRGIEEALRRDPRLHFVSTGGAIEGHVEVVYTRFVELVEKSPLRERFHLLGWVPHTELTDLMLGADVGVNCDFATYEGELGCRNRLYGWLWAGMRVVTTVSSEPTRRLVEQGWAREVAAGDWLGLGAALVEEASKGRPGDLAERQARLRAQWAPERFFGAFTEWVRKPTRAPDRRERDEVSNPLADLQRRFLEAAAREEEVELLREAAGDLAAHLAGSRAIQLYGKLHPETLALIEQLRRLGDK